ncbi:hypothetical protein BJY04DRAFT_213210 [Aspergillus karnatakaensis]|uniref:uncharacterized protein n=1 Tax=Aspergillus karnatakaensis TaxID=1810916 RepID=UPI003CCCEEA0
MRLSALVYAATTLAPPVLALVENWSIPPAGQSGTITDPSRIYCIIDDGRLDASPDCTIFTSDGAGGFETASGGWLHVNEESHEIEIVSSDVPAFHWEGSLKAIGEGSTELLSYFAAAEEEPLYGPTWNHIPGTNHVGIWTGDFATEAPVVLSFVPQ